MSPKTPPGQTRRQVLGFVRDRLLAGRPPTVREVQEAFRFRSVQSAREHLEALVAEGKLIKEGGVSRGYRLPPSAELGAPRLVPLLGRVQAGDLTAAIEEPDGGYISVQVPALGEGLFALRVRGESMQGAGILPGDVVVVRRQSTASPGDIVVALVGEEATVKRLRRVRGRAELHPANPAFAPIVPAQGELAILGVVIEVRRYLEGPFAASR
jgi:repressor LexA